MGPPNSSRASAELMVGGSVRIIEWPTEGQALDELAKARAPRLVLVEEGDEPPVASDCCQDWMWRTGGERELRLRLRQLSLRALAHGHERPHLDPLGFLYVGLRSVHLSPKEQALAGVLLEGFNEMVTPEQLIQAAWPKGIRKPNVLAHRISALRSRLDWLGLDILGSSTKGYTMRVQAGTGDRNGGGGFEDELENKVASHRAPRYTQPQPERDRTA